MEHNIFEAVNKLMKINRGHKYLIDSQVADIGLHRTHHRILMYLARNGNLPSQKKLAECFDITPAAISGALGKLECDGYIERKLGEDSRFNQVTITERGREIVETTRERFAHVDNGLFKGFSEDDMTAFVGYLSRILENMKGSE